MYFQEKGYTILGKEKISFWGFLTSEEKSNAPPPTQARLPSQRDTFKCKITNVIVKSIATRAINLKHQLQHIRYVKLPLASAFTSPVILTSLKNIHFLPFVRWPAVFHVSETGSQASTFAMIDHHHDHNF